MTPPIALHIGFSRTATTTHQAHLFAKHPQIVYLGKPHGDFLQDQIYRLLKQDTITYSPAKLADYIRDRARENHAPGTIILLSNEILLSRGKSLDKGVVAQRIKDAFYPCKIIITIRGQLDILKSAYLTSGRMLDDVPGRYRGLSVSFDEWLEFSYRQHQGMDKNYITHVDYFKTIDCYARLFGRENTGVFLFEEFVHNTEEYTRRLSDFLGIDARESLRLVSGKHEHREISQAQLNFERLQTKLYPLSRTRMVSFLLSGYYKLSRASSKEKPPEIDITGQWLERLSDIFSSGNRRLIEEYGLPLEQYGYPCRLPN
jgi:hypothetical protein